MPKRNGINYQVLYPTGQPLKGIVVVTHGYSEHSGRYEELYQAILQTNWGVVSYDVRGHGKSDGIRGYIGDFNQYVKDFEMIQQEAEKIETATGNLVFVAHSMGGLITLRYLLAAKRNTERFKACILSAPFVGMATELTLSERILVNGMNRIYPAFKSPFSMGFEKNISHDPSFHENRPQDEGCFEHATIRWVVQCKKAQKYVKKHQLELGKIVPIHWFVAGQDSVCSSSDIRAMANAISNEDPKYVSKTYEFPDFFHEIFQEQNRQEPFKYLQNILAGI